MSMENSETDEQPLSGKAAEAYFEKLGRANAKVR